MKKQNHPRDNRDNRDNRPKQKQPAKPAPVPLKITLADLNAKAPRKHPKGEGFRDSEWQSWWDEYQQKPESALVRLDSDLAHWLPIIIRNDPLLALRSKDVAERLGWVLIHAHHGKNKHPCTTACRAIAEAMLPCRDGGASPHDSKAFLEKAIRREQQQTKHLLTTEVCHVLWDLWNYGLQAICLSGKVTWPTKTDEKNWLKKWTTATHDKKLKRVVAYAQSWNLVPNAMDLDEDHVDRVQGAYGIRNNINFKTCAKERVCKARGFKSTNTLDQINHRAQRA